MKNIFNQSELARKVGLHPALFNMKRNRINYNKFSEKELDNIKKVIEEEAVKFIDDLNKKS